MITIVTDSTSCLTKKEALSMGVRIVPVNYTVDGREYAESYSGNNGDFERLLSQNQGRCTTSQSSVAAFMSVFEEIIRQGGEVLCITLSSRLSGQYSSASVAAKKAGGRIVIVDSQNTAGGLALLVKKAFKLAAGGQPLAALAKAVEKLRAATGSVFSVDNIGPLRASGRLGIVRQSVGTILNIKPILICEDGAVISGGVARGRAEQVKKMVEKIPAGAKELIVNYLGGRESAAALINALKIRFPKTPIFESALGPVLGIHLGTGAVAVSWISE